MVVYEQGEPIKIDCTHSFTMSEKFSTKEALLAWVREGTKEPKDNEKAEWKLEVYSGIHNHNLFENLHGHSYAGRLSKEQTSFVHTLKKAMVKPMTILRLWKENDPSNLKEDEYLSYHRPNELNAVTDLLWIHPKCIKLAQSYPYVFVIDCT
ncbi:PREDICTED: uncharacterized protein LOC105958773 [Erythranthe guttata]|uniref:uncharacterized protein LOC105958773 n=1 Tax=Erythranthe guttata TaxID=4155 RepID=UPI00064DC931|nr:PREDICTED: uncharacterized protein LOC105958773 [Erythranthe guttata]|eukprot:XP_012838231.1 PREDICTED: uncharacterized protein LOC105958773 [Erythranthe guttata]